MKSISLFSGYIYLIVAIITGIASNGFLKTTESLPSSYQQFFALQVLLFVFFVYLEQ